jgi:hypothetical protein
VSDPVLTFFLSYWRQKQQGKDVPRAADFVPKEVRSNLRWVVVIDALPGYADFRYRVVGSSVCEYFLGDGTGKTVRQTFGSLGMVGGLLWLYRTTCTTARPLRCTGPSNIVNDVFFPPYDSLYLPYSTDGQNVDRLVNTFVFNYAAIREKRPYNLAGLVTGPSVNTE